LELSEKGVISRDDNVLSHSLGLDLHRPLEQLQSLLRGFMPLPPCLAPRRDSFDHESAFSFDGPFELQFRLPMFVLQLAPASHSDLTGSSQVSDFVFDPLFLSLESGPPRLALADIVDNANVLTWGVIVSAQVWFLVLPVFRIDHIPPKPTKITLPKPRADSLAGETRDYFAAGIKRWKKWLTRRRRLFSHVDEVG